MQGVRKLVVAGLIVGDDGRILIAQRRADQAMGLKWEFPGGKVEPGESPAAALARELREELDVSATVDRIWEVLHHRYDEFELVMLVYLCSLEQGQSPRRQEVQDLAWCTPRGLLDYDILAADRPLIDRLLAEGVPSPG